MQQILTSTSKIMVDAKAGSQMLYLPLDKIMQLSGPGSLPEPPVTARNPAQSEPTPAAESGARSRDALRNRDREGRP